MKSIANPPIRIKPASIGKAVSHTKILEANILFLERSQKLPATKASRTSGIDHDISFPEVVMPLFIGILSPPKPVNVLDIIRNSETVMSIVIALMPTPI